MQMGVKLYLTDLRLSKHFQTVFIIYQSYLYLEQFADVRTPE